MKKVAVIIPIIMIFLITILTFVYLNFKEASTYLKFNNYERDTIAINYDSNNDNLIKSIKEIVSLAKKNNVILIKNNVDNKKNKGSKLYISLDSIEELKKVLNDNFSIRIINNYNDIDGFFSTYNQNDDKQVGIINDLFGDHYYTYYLMNQLFEKNDNMFGNYLVLYDDLQNYNNFMNDINDLMGKDMRSMSISNGIQKYVGIIIIGSLIFLSLFYFIFQIYIYNSNSKKIGCMKLLGIDNFRINQNLIFKRIIAYLICSIITSMLSILFVKNISINHILLVFGINLLIILITYVISAIACAIICKNYEITNILKFQNVTLKISKVSYVFKSIMTIMLLCFMVIASQKFGDLVYTLQKYNSSKKLLDYGVLQTYVANQPEEYNYDRQYNAFKDIKENMDTFYAQFIDYSQYTQEDFNNVKISEENGKFYNYESVDKNYLNKEKIKVYDLNRNEIDIDSIEGIFFLFPTSKQNKIEAFKSFNSQLDEYYLKYNENYEFKAYLYNDQKIDTYQIDNRYVENPIIRVLDDSLRKPYYTDGIGVSNFGEGLITGLKIKLIDGDKSKTIEQLRVYFEKNNISNLFSSASFISYKEYFNDEILASRLAFIFLVIAIVIIVSVYILISSQLLRLYIISQRKKVLVKKLLGFDNNLIFEQIYKRNLTNTIISIILSLLVLIILKKFNIFFTIFIVIILILDFMVTMISIKLTKLSKIYLDLKGGYND